LRHVPSFVWYTAATGVTAVISIILNHFRPIPWLNTNVRKLLVLIILIVISTGLYTMQSMGAGRIRPRIILGNGAIVNWCQDFIIEASVDDGQELWLTYRGDKYGTYFMRPAAFWSGNDQWRVRATIGNKGDAWMNYRFQAILIDKRWADWLRSMRDPVTLGKGLFGDRIPVYVATELPPSIEKSAAVSGTRNEGGTPC
jgi:hypothetical protein